jgi:hypothetical protein
MLRIVIVARLAEFLGACGGAAAPRRNDNGLRRNLSDVDVPNQPGFVK